MIEIVSVLVALCLICVTLRVVARLRRRVGFGMDDYLSFASMILMIAMLVELILCELLSNFVLFTPLTVLLRVCNRRQWYTRRGRGP